MAGLCGIDACVDRQLLMKPEQLHHVPDRRAGRYYQAELGIAARCLVMDPEQAVQARAVAEPGAGEVGDDHGRAGSQSRGELVVDLLRVRQVDLGGKRHDHGPATCQLITHRFPFLAWLSGLYVLPPIPDINLALLRWCDGMCWGYGRAPAVRQLAWYPVRAAA